MLNLVESLSVSRACLPRLREPNRDSRVSQHRRRPSQFSTDNASTVAVFFSLLYALAQSIVYTCVADIIYSTIPQPFFTLQPISPPSLSSSLLQTRLSDSQAILRTMIRTPSLAHTLYRQLGDQIVPLPTLYTSDLPSRPQLSQRQMIKVTGPLSVLLICVLALGTQERCRASHRSWGHSCHDLVQKLQRSERRER